MIFLCFHSCQSLTFYFIKKSFDFTQQPLVIFIGTVVDTFYEFWLCHSQLSVAWVFKYYAIQKLNINDTFDRHIFVLSNYCN